jgi:hypothetical protein
MDTCIAAIDDAFDEICEGDTVFCDAPFANIIGAEFLTLDTMRTGEVRIEGLINFGWFDVSSQTDINRMATDVDNRQRRGVNTLASEDEDGNVTAANDTRFPTITFANRTATTEASRDRTNSNMRRVATGINGVVEQFIMGNPTIVGCVIGRDLSQATGARQNRQDAQGNTIGDVAQARFPRLADAKINQLLRTGLNSTEDAYREHLNRRQRDAIKAIMAKRESDDAFVDDGTVCWIPTGRGGQMQ